MATVVTRIDGQNVGVRLLGQTTIAPISLDLTTGSVSSEFLDSQDCTILTDFALNLFDIVPKTARPAAAIGLLSRLCAVSPADASTVTLASTVSSGIATLLASVGSSPASLILTIPFAMTGGVMPSTGGSGSGPTPPSSDSNLVAVTLGEPLSAGQPVCLSGGVALLARADDPARMPAVGVLESIQGETEGTARLAGLLTTISGVTEGAIHWIGATGQIVASPPSVSGQIVQAIGFGLSSTSLSVAPSSALAIR